VVFALTYFLIAVPAQNTSDRIAREARELSGVQAAKTDVDADLELFAHIPPTGHRRRVLVAEAETLFQRGNTAFDSGSGAYTAALANYRAALIKLREVDELEGRRHEVIGLNAPRSEPDGDYPAVMHLIGE
jgi:hypothetical protein